MLKGTATSAQPKVSDVQCWCQVIAQLWEAPCDRAQSQSSTTAAASVLAKPTWKISYCADVAQLALSCFLPIKTSQSERGMPWMTQKMLLTSLAKVQLS